MAGTRIYRDGRALDARFTVELVDGQATVVVESRGGARGTPAARNIDYATGLELLLARLAAMHASVANATVDSAAVRNLPTSQRVLRLDEHPYPISIANPTALQRALGAAQARVGRSFDAKGSGNRTKRIRLALRFESSTPTVAHLRTVLAGRSESTTVQVERVETAEDVRRAIDAFNDPHFDAKLARSLLRSTWYWAFDPTSGNFGPSKFCGFRELSASAYLRARAGRFRGANFDGNVARTAIETATQLEFKPNSSVETLFRGWVNNKFRHDALERIDDSKWEFLELPPVGAEEPPATRRSVAGIMEKQDPQAVLARQLTMSPHSAEDVYREVKQRGIAQQVFREVLMIAYGGACAICGLTLEATLTAAHIVHWRDCKGADRMNPSNGLLLCANHHAMFDAGWLRITDTYGIEFVATKRENGEYSAMDDALARSFHGKKLRLPEAPQLWPDPEKLRARKGTPG